MNWTEKSRDIWDVQAGRWDANPNMWFEGPRAEMFDFLCEFLGKQGLKVLDLGCGPGVSTQRMTDFGYNAIGVDHSSEMVEYAKARGVPAVLTQGEQLPFDNGSFHAVFACTSLEWSENPSHMIQEVHRVLRTNGSFVAVTMGASANPRKTAYRRLYGEPVIHNMMMPWELLQLCEDVGFVCDSMHGSYPGIHSDVIAGLGDNWVAKSSLAFLWGFGFLKQ